MLTTNHEDCLANPLRAGDAVAFDALFDIYGKRLYGFAFKYLKSEPEAEELVQEVFVRIWENRKSLKSNHSFRAYLFKIALNQIRNFFNKRSLSLKYVSQVTDGNPEWITAWSNQLIMRRYSNGLMTLLKHFPNEKSSSFKKAVKKVKSQEK